MWDLLHPFTFGPRDVQTSIIHISTTPTMEFPFDQYLTGGTLRKAIRDTRQLMGDTNTGKALSYAKEKLFSGEAGARPDVPKVLVWVTDGFSTDDISEPMQLLKDMGVTVFIVSTGRSNFLELSAAASQPSDKHLHFVDVDDLPIITKELRDGILGRLGWGALGGGSRAEDGFVFGSVGWAVGEFPKSCGHPDLKVLFWKNGGVCPQCYRSKYKPRFWEVWDKYIPLGIFD